MPTPIEPNAEGAVDLTENRLLAALPDTEREEFAAHAQLVYLDTLEVIGEPHAPLPYAYFPLNGIISIVALDAEGGVVEVGTAGNEGMTGLPAVLGLPTSPFQTLGQVPGVHARVPMDTLIALAAPGTAMYTLLLRYAQAFSVLAGQSAACNRLHPMEERCARWILLVHDRVGTDTFTLTHEVLGQMLGVRRPSVTVAAGLLQRAGFIMYQRGHVTILDRPGLEAAACECYSIIQSQFARLYPHDEREQPSNPPIS